MTARRVGWGRVFLGSTVLLLAWSCSSAQHDFGEGSQSESGAAGAGDQHEGGVDGIGTPGSAGAGAVMSGGAGAGGGAVGSAGSEQGASLSVVSVSPEDGATEVERDESIEVTFSEPVDPASITSDSLSVEGPEGKIDGKLSVAGEIVTFTPAAQFELLANYKVSLSTDITGEQSGALDAPHEFAFQARDGKFRSPERISTSDAVNLTITGNRAGYVAAFWSTNDAKRNAEAAIFDPIKAAWEEAALLENDDTLSYDVSCLALNESGQAFATLMGVAGSAVTAGGWNRRLGTDWGIARLTVVKESRACALADDGTAMTAWVAVVGNGADVLAASLSANDQWSESQTLQVNDHVYYPSTARFGAGFMVVYARDSDHASVSSVWDPKAGWLAPRLVSTDTTFAGLVSDGAQAMTLWLDKNDHVHASLLADMDWAPAKDLGVSDESGITGGVGNNGSLVTWSGQGAMWASHHDSTNGWTDALKLAATPDDLLPPTGVIDDRGNALVAWVEGRNISWRRWSVSAKAWDDPVAFKDQDVTSYGILSSVDAAGNIMLVWQNQLGVWASRFE